LLRPTDPRVGKSIAGDVRRGYGAVDSLPPHAGPSETVKRLLLALIGVYVVVAVVTRVAEARGAWSLECGCHADCWCKQPGLNLFRWVTPRRMHHLWTDDEKRAFAEAEALSQGLP